MPPKWFLCYNLLRLLRPSENFIKKTSDISRIKGVVHVPWPSFRIIIKDTQSHVHNALGAPFTI